MDSPSNRRLFGLCLLAAASGFGVWLLLFRDTSGLWIFGLAAVIFAGLMFIDGYYGVA